MKTKFDIGDEIYTTDKYGEKGYYLLGTVKQITLMKYELEYSCRNLSVDHKVGDLVEILYFKGSQSGNLQGVEVSEVFKTKEEAIRASIAIREAELLKEKECMVEAEAEIARLKELL